MQKISTRLLALIQENSRYVELEKGSVLFYEGDIARIFFIAYKAQSPCLWM